jgi:hypothetical protein
MSLGVPVYNKESQRTGRIVSRPFIITRKGLLFAFRNLEGMFKYLSIIFNSRLLFQEHPFTSF